MGAAQAYSEDVAAVAVAICERRFAGDRAATLHGIEFEFFNDDGSVHQGWCGEFVRQCYASAWRAVDSGFDEFGFPWCAPNARIANDKLKSFADNRLYGVKRMPFDTAPAGSIIAFRMATPGHIAVKVDQDTIAENTSSARGQGHPGTGLTPWTEVAAGVEAVYRVLPTRAVAGVKYHLIGVDGKELSPAALWLGDDNHGYGMLLQIAAAAGCNLAWNQRDTWTLTKKA